MKKILSLVVALALVMVFGLGTGIAQQSYSNSNNMGSASGAMAKGGMASYEGFDLRGTKVTNPQGEGLGRISDFVIDHDGRIILVVLYRTGNVAFEDGKYGAVPFSALSISEPKPHEVIATLNVDEQKLAQAPSFDIGKGLTDMKSADAIYRYFGQQPYWTEGE